jgi:hypothetical protein
MSYLAMSCHVMSCQGFWEDVNVANCLRASADIEAYDTRDNLER